MGCGFFGNQDQKKLLVALLRSRERGDLLLGFILFLTRKNIQWHFKIVRSTIVNGSA